MPRTSSTTKDLAKQVRKSKGQKIKEEDKKVTYEQLVPTGSTLFNLALSDDPRGGFGVGTVVNIIGGRSSGKTLLALSCFAEMAQQKRFDAYRDIFDDAEAALAFNLEYLFGKKTADRIEAPAYDKEDYELASDTVEDYQDYTMAALDKGKPFVYVLDSLDSISSEQEMEKVEEDAKKRATGTQTTGTFGMAKAKAMSALFRVITRKVSKADSLMIVLSQTRVDANPMTRTTKTRSGGQALEFYSTHEVWLTIKQKLKKKVRGKDRIVGVLVEANITKNKLTGKLRKVQFPVYYDYGVDDIGSMVDWLIEEGVWVKDVPEKEKKDRKKREQMTTADKEKEKKTTKIKATHLGITATPANVIQEIENNNQQKELRQICWNIWKEIEEACKTPRARKYQ